MRPLVWTDRKAAVAAAIAIAWLASIELGTSRSASRAAKASGASNGDETVIDTTTSRLFDTAALTSLSIGVASSVSIPSATVPLRRTSFATGLALLLGSGMLSWVARRHLGRFHRDALTVHSDHILIDTGPYRRIRHPLYLATTGAAIGIAATLGNWISLGTTTLPVAALIHRINVEEKMLVERLGDDYRSYRLRTHRMLPKIW